ncbi:LysR family transcriptional regulator [Stappia indica]|uniref:LysR family transcriptional regulator n=1 Tax=Stappia indica TaxID=538381 RepID=A0A857C727_9HYPH|nr:LysR family transcriptional regulator [Stappia indica]QGZ34731.1 LysR family transcriptional regulator [Stappia indica]
MFELKDVEILQDIVRAGGFRAAAAKYGLSQSAISNRVLALEKRLGIQLFDRGRRQVRLTPVGRRFLEEAQRLSAARDRLIQEITRPGGLSGTIRIGVAETIVHTILSELLNQLKSAHQRVRFELSVDTSRELGLALADDGLDVAIMLRESVPSGAAVVPLQRQPLGWYGAASDKEGADAEAGEPLTLTDLARQTIVSFPKGTPPFRELEGLLAAPDLPPPDLHGSASLSTVLHLVADGFGIGVLPVRIAEADLFRSRIRPLKVVEEARLSALRFVVAYMPDRNREVGEEVAAVARACDQNDLERRS